MLWVEIEKETEPGFHKEETFHKLAFNDTEWAKKKYNRKQTFGNELGNRQNQMAMMPPWAHMQIHSGKFKWDLSSAPSKHKL